MNWLPLAEYSMKHRISVSTLRRKIKADEIKFRLDDGKYMILDSTEEHRPSLNSESSVENKNLAPNHAYQNHGMSVASESVFSAANKLLSELRTAYNEVLEQKEHQIVALKEEISDLKTLIQVLESENQRLRNQ